MKTSTAISLILGGVALGATLGILLAPAKGSDTRNRIAKLLEEKGIKLNKEEMEQLIDKILARKNV